MAKKRNWREPQRAKAVTEGDESWWYGEPNSVCVVIRRPNQVTLIAKVYRRDIEAWLREVKPK